MRKLFFIGLITLFLGSCSVDNDNIVNEILTEFVPIITVQMPEEFELEQTYVINYTYNRPSTCHTFSNLFYEIGNQNQITIAVINSVVNAETGCETLTDEVIARSFDFIVDTSETYNFRFWQGKDNSGQDIYLEFEVPVNN